MMDKITAAAATARLKRFNCAFEFKNNGILIRIGRKTRHIAYVDDLGTLVAARDVVSIERELRLSNAR